ncbi:MAG: hypothetical protein FWF14_01465 [Streptococcaceae bacterium]|nr:hypothetical protein [Streptococcaceae bacterium]
MFTKTETERPHMIEEIHLDIFKHLKILVKIFITQDILMYQYLTEVEKTI